jgi:hypothetical protein
LKKLLSFLAVPAIMASASFASYIPPSYVLRLETVKPGLLRLTNTSTAPIYVTSFVLRNHTVNELGKRTGEVDKILVDVNAPIAPGQSLLDQTGNGYRTTANTELVQWKEKRKIHRDGLLICFINDFNHNVFVTPNGHLPCPK